MRVLYAYAGLQWWWDHERRMIERVNSAQNRIHITLWNWLAEYGFSVNPSLAWTRDHPDSLLPFHRKLKRRAQEYDALLIHETGAIPPEVMAELPCTVIYSTTDDPDSSENCSIPFLQAADVIAHAAVNYDATRRLRDVFLAKGAKRCIFWPIGFFEEQFPPLDDFDTQFDARDIDLLYIGHVKRGKLERIMRRFPQMRVHGKSLRLKHKLYMLAFTRRWIRPFIGDLGALYRRAKVGINMHFSFGPCNARCYQLNAAGVAQVLDCPEGAAEIYTPGQEVLVYDGLPNAIENVETLLQDPSLRRRVARAGYERARSDYPRWKTLLRLLEQV